MNHQRQKSSSSVLSDLSKRSFLSVSSDSGSVPSVSSSPAYRNSLSPNDTPHKRNRFRTLFFTPSIRDSGISLSNPTSGPWFPSPLTPPSCPLPPIPVQEDPVVQEELDFLVAELASRFDWEENSGVVYPASDRCDSPTLGHFPTVQRHSSTAMGSKQPANSSKYGKRRASPLPGASHLNSPVDVSIRELAIRSRSASTQSSTASPRPTVRRASPLLGLPQVFRRLAITDPHVNGQPIRFLSQDYVAGANSLQVGSCTFMNLPYGADVECGLRVEPSSSSTQSVILQIVQRTVRIRDGSSVWLLCSEVDVSACFTSEVREELTNTVFCSASPQYTPGKEKEQSDDDIWVALAHQLGTNAYAPSTTRLPPASSRSTTNFKSPALTDLLSLLTEVRFLHRQFFILQPKLSSKGDLGIGIPYMSSSLHTSLSSLPSLTKSTDPCKRNFYGYDTSAYESDSRVSSPLTIFVNAAVQQARNWLQDSNITVIREMLTLPRVGRSQRVNEQIGVYGIRVGESWGEGRKQGLGCWVCFLVPKGVEREL